MVRGWAVAAIGMALSVVAVAAAEPSRHEKTGLEVTFPEKWIVGSGDEPLLLISRSMDQVSLANCVATGEVVAATRGLTQDRINQELAAPFGESFWKDVYATAGLVAEVKSQGTRAHKSGVMIQEAYFDLSKQGAAPESRMSIQQAIFVRPGMTITVACSARAAAYPKHKAVLSAVIDSVRFGDPSTPVANAGAASTVPVKDGALSPVDTKKLAGDASRAGAELVQLAR